MYFFREECFGFIYIAVLILILYSQNFELIKLNKCKIPKNIKYKLILIIFAIKTLNSIWYSISGFCVGVSIELLKSNL